MSCSWSFGTKGEYGCPKLAHARAAGYAAAVSHAGHQAKAEEALRRGEAQCWLTLMGKLQHLPTREGCGFTLHHARRGPKIEHA